MFDKKPIESLDHKNLPKAYKPEELQKMNADREAAANAKAPAAAPSAAPGKSGTPGGN